MGKSMEKESTPPHNFNTAAFLTTASLTPMASLIIKMGKNMRVTLKTERKMVKGSTLGPMGLTMKVFTKMT